MRGAPCAFGDCHVGNLLRTGDGAIHRYRFPLSGKRSYLAEGSKSVKKSLFFKKGIDKILFLCYPFLMVSFI